MEEVNWTLGVIELHDFGYMIHERKQCRPYKFALPSVIQRIRDIPNRTQYSVIR